MKYGKFIATAMAILFISCGTSRITSTWKSKNNLPKRFNKILVLGLVQDKDRLLREQMEQHLLVNLQSYGYNAICACDEYGPKSFENMTEKEAIDKLSNSGIDAVLTVVLLDKTRERYYVPARVDYSPYGVYRNRFWRYYTTMFDRIYTPGYYAIQTKYFWESNLYDMGSKELCYSVQTRSFDPSSSESLAREYGQLIVKNMISNKILENKPQQTLKSF